MAAPYTQSDKGKTLAVLLDLNGRDPEGVINSIVKRHGLPLRFFTPQMIHMLYEEGLGWEASSHARAAERLLEIRDIVLKTRTGNGKHTKVSRMGRYEAYVLIRRCGTNIEQACYAAHVARSRQAYDDECGVLDDNVPVPVAAERLMERLDAEKRANRAKHSAKKAAALAQPVTSSVALETDEDIQRLAIEDGKNFDMEAEILKSGDAVLAITTQTAVVRDVIGMLRTTNRLLGELVALWTPAQQQ